MGNDALNKDSELVVGENKLMAWVLAILFFALFAYGVYDAIKLRFKHIDYQSYVLVLALVPCIFCLRRVKSKRVYVRINRTGIYKDEQLVTSWSNLLKAYLGQEKKKKFYDLQDKFILIVEYRGTDPKMGYRKKIPLTNTQNKSEEDVLEAVQFFWRLYRHQNGS
ncbi:MAG: hypothetical protein SGI83_08025 [Bacteroidota bacterium]|nr:hypothetical protein [Bacteroidota bacterium]